MQQKWNLYNLPHPEVILLSIKTILLFAWALLLKSTIKPLKPIKLNIVFTSFRKMRYYDAIVSCTYYVTPIFGICQHKFQKILKLWNYFLGCGRKHCNSSALSLIDGPSVSLSAAFKNVAIRSFDITPLLYRKTVRNFTFICHFWTYIKIWFSFLYCLKNLTCI